MSERRARLGRTLRRVARGDGGQALAEFAFVLPVLVLMMVGIIELGSAWRTQQVLTHSAREAARLAVIPTSTQEQVVDRINGSLMAGGLEPTRARLALALRSGTGSLDTVRVHYPQAFPLTGPAIRLISPGAASKVPGSIELTSTAVMRNE